MTAVLPHCQCGHRAAMHEHYRAGSDCASCRCPYYLPGRPVVSREFQRVVLLAAAAALVAVGVAVWWGLT